MGIFYNPPQPPTANNAGTPPEPHAPIGTQGSQPPRYSTVLMMAAVLASWPADLEPRLHQQNAQQNKIAPLTLTYGQQPPQRAPLAVLNQSTILATWQQTWDAQRAPKSLAWDVPISPYLARTPPPPLIWDAWIPPPPLPARPVQIAPLTLAYGAQPTPQPPLSTVELAQIVGTWAQTWDAQTAPKSAAWNIPPIVSTLVPRTPLPQSIWTAWEPLPLPPRPVAIAPLTLPYGSQPTPQPPLSVVELAQIAASWQQTWDAQAAAKSAGWNIPPIVSAFVPRTSPPALIWTAWEPPYIAPPRPVAIAPLTLVYGNAPPIRGVSPLQAQIAATWADPPSIQAGPKTAAWNVPPLVATIVPANPYPYGILRAWQDDPIRLPRLVTIAPLTLVYGSQPPVQAPLSAANRIALQSWPADLEPRLGRPNAERVRIAPLTLTYGNPPTPHGPLSPTLLRILTGSWLTDASATRAARTMVPAGGVSATVGVIHLTGSNQPIITLTGQGSGGVFDLTVFDPTVFDTGNTIVLTGSYQPIISLTGQGSDDVFDHAVFDPAVFDTVNRTRSCSPGAISQ
jgi:hypothetical protein